MVSVVGRSTPSRSTTFRSVRKGTNDENQNHNMNNSTSSSGSGISVGGGSPSIVINSTSKRSNQRNNNRYAKDYQNHNKKNSNSLFRIIERSYPKILCSIGTMIVLWNIITYLFFGNNNNNNDNIDTNMKNDTTMNISEPIYFTTTLDTFPEYSIELWPDHHHSHYNSYRYIHTLHNQNNQQDNNHHINVDTAAIVEERLFDLYIDCLPHENGDCLERRNDAKNNIQRIAILRTPGVIGEVIDDFITQLIEKSIKDSTSTYNIEIVRTSHIDPDNYHDYTHVIRSSIFPFLLEAIDLALRSISTNDEIHNNVNNNNKNNIESNIYTMNDITFHNDILGIIRQIIRWNLRISEYIGKDTALLTIPFDRMMSYPLEVEKQILSFLHINIIPTTTNTDGNKKQQQKCYVQIDHLAEKVIQRVDACNAFIMKIIKEYSNTNNNNNNNNQSLTPLLSIQLAIDQVIHDELVAVKNVNPNEMISIKPLRGYPIQRTRCTELVGHFLDRTLILSEKICRKYRKSYMCMLDTSGTIKI